MCNKWEKLWPGKRDISSVCCSSEICCMRGDYGNKGVEMKEYAGSKYVRILSFITAFVFRVKAAKFYASFVSLGRN